MPKRLKKSWMAVLIVMLLSAVHCKSYAMAIEQDLAPNALSAILMDAETGMILYEKNSHQPLPPASITKLMTMLLVMEAIDQGKIKLTDPVRVSEHAASMGGTQVYLEPGETMSVSDMLKAVAIASANDAAVALAEFLGGTEENFVQMMNQKAQKLGLKNTQFQNASGLPAENHYASAYDIAIISRELLRYPKITKFTGVYQDYLRQDTEKPFWLVNTNKLIRFYPGMDGLKTGYTSEAKFCLAATAKKGNMRMIAVVMGEPNSKQRNQEIVRMMDYAFNQYTKVPIYNKGDLIAKVQIDKGDPETVYIYADKPFHLLVKKGEQVEDYQKKWHWNKLNAPIHSGDSLGVLEFSKDGKTIAKLGLISKTEIKKANFWSNYRRLMTRILWIPEDQVQKEK